MKRWICALAGVIGLGGCGTTIEAYRDTTPRLVLEDYFNGTLDAWGMFQDRSGKVIKRFHVLIEARWQGAVGRLDERFTYDDGSTQRRVWTLTARGDGHYTGLADDVVGQAQGQARGNALRWRYVMALPVNGKTYHVDFDDWMYLMGDGVLLNRSVMSKFGVRLGEVTLSFRKREGRAP
ncbi:DUF3833 domain-containing protein [Nitrogeniibacter mangrovi]|uniref:DUF3833 domain-containing protein n=1 Tax=Nitrogeniibacter mangrovi TaxID=2016596 RepID=A0A6C1B483_9RHOO|nr:DUF3833 domain-containing protein [Nitrogeniibacter mangrovi]QID17080.1 DUF3833 domain-containing protein [Nitrogeniibacter mangrovi]